MPDARPPLVVSLRREPRPLRDWRTLDAFLYNLMTMNLAVMFTVPLLAALAFFPHASLPLAILIAGLFCCAEALVYAFLASSMPRSGGDHYFQSRLLSPLAGTIFASTGVVLGGALWMAIAGWFAANVAVGPLFSTLGRVTGAGAFTDAASFVRSSTGMFLLSLLVIGWSAAINVWGMRAYASVQKAFWIAGAAALVLLVVLVWRFGASGLGSAAPYREALHIARLRGFDPDGHTASLAVTLALVPVAAFSLIYPAWSVQQAGEVRSARRLRSQLVAIVGSEAITVTLSILAVTILLAQVDWDALAAGAWLFFLHREAMPLQDLPFFWFYDGSFWPGGVAILGLCLLFNAWFWMWVPDITLAASRVLLSMALSRTMPRWLGEESGPRRAPARAILVFSGLCVAPAALYAYTSLWRLTLSATLLNVLAFAVTCAAAALMPYLHRELYRESTAARFELFGVPLITWCGAAFCAFSALLVWRFAVDPRLALGAPKWMLLAFAAALYAVAYLFHVLASGRGRREAGLELEITYRVRS